MSATELIAELKKLPPHEREEFRRLFEDVDLSEDRPAQADRAAKVSAAIDRILTDNAQVFEKLAQ